MLQLQRLKKIQLQAFTQVPKKKSIIHQNTLIIIGDWNTKVGNKAESNAIETFGLGVRNEAEEKIDSWISAKPTTCPLQTHASKN